jgi:ferric-dicitrate binding protein FerR (iron transport regulator)
MKEDLFKDIIAKFLKGDATGHEKRRLSPLSEVTDIIDDYYDVEMIIADSLLGTRQFTGSLPNNDLDLILLALSTSYRIEIERRGDRIILRNEIPN